MEIESRNLPLKLNHEYLAELQKVRCINQGTITVIWEINEKKIWSHYKRCFDRVFHIRGTCCFVVLFSVFSLITETRTPHRFLNGATLGADIGL